MAYNQFTINQISKQFGLQILEDADLFPSAPPVAPSEPLRLLLARYIPLAEAIGTEKAKSEFIIAPLLAELREQAEHRISLFSGVEFNVDEQQGLNGRCDYIVSHSSLQFSLRAPLLMMVEAKNDNLNSGLGQCMAEMVAARMFNEREGDSVDAVFGCVTTGSIWRFLMLSGNTLTIDDRQYFIESVENILGVLATIIAR